MSMYCCHGDWHARRESKFPNSFSLVISELPDVDAKPQTVGNGDQGNQWKQDQKQRGDENTEGCS